MGVINYGESRWNGVAKHSTGRHSQQFDIVRVKSIDSEIKKTRRGCTHLYKAFCLSYSIVLN